MSDHYTKEKSFGCFSFSVLAHAGAVVALAVLPQAGLLSEGTVPLGNSIEFTAVETPQGSQVTTLRPSETEILAEEPTPKPALEKKTQPVAVAKKEKAPSPEVLPAPVVETPAEEEPIDAQEDPILEAEAEDELPEPMEDLPVVAEEEVEPSSEKPVVATELPDKDINEEPHQEEPSPELKPIAVVEPPKDTPKEQLPTEKSTAAESIENASQNLEKEKVPAPTPEEDASLASGQGLQEKAQELPQSDQAFGTPSGSTRSYLDLAQIPGNVPPQYPTKARRFRQQGQVKLAYYVQPNGAVTNVKLVQSSGHTLLDQEAVRAIRQFKYQPGQQGWTVHPVNFELRGPSQKIPSRLRTSSRGQTTVYN